MIVALLWGVAAVGPPAPVDQHGQTVFVTWDAGAKSCVPQINGVETGPIATEEGKAALVAALHDKGAALRLIGRSGFVISYDCAADIAATLKHSGFYGRIDLGSEPSTGSAAR